MQDGRLTSYPFKIISLDSSTHEWNHPASATMSITTTFAASVNTSAHHVPFLEYKDLCNDVRKAFPGLASLVDSIESALATTISEDLKKDDNDGNLLDLDSYTHRIHIPASDECITPVVSIQLDCIVPKVSLQLHDFKTFSATGISIHDLFFGKCGDAMLAPH